VGVSAAIVGSVVELPPVVIKAWIDVAAAEVALTEAFIAQFPRNAVVQVSPFTALAA
jgi:hypothetical protein